MDCLLTSEILNHNTPPNPTEEQIFHLLEISKDPQKSPSKMTEPATKRLKLDAATATRRLYSTDQDLQLLAEWVINNGGYFSDILELYKDEMARLAGTNLGAGDVALRKALWMEEWETGLQAFREIGGIENIDRYTWDLYLRAATIYTSRSFPSKLVGIKLGATIPPVSEAQKNTESFPVLIPLVDILNHQPKTKIVWKPTPESFSLEALGCLSIGSQVFNNYGPKANEELLMGYGFVIPDSPVDSLAMKFTMLPRDPVVAAIWEQRESRSNWSEVFHLAKSSMNIDVKPGECALENDWPGPLVDLFRLLVVNEQELKILKDEDPNKIPVSTRNELAVALGLKQAMTQKLTTLCRYDSSLKLPPRNRKEESADIYRKGQQDIMVSKLQKLDEFISNYAPARRLGSSQYLSENEWLEQIFDDFPIPTGLSGEEDDEEDKEFELVDKGELVLLIAILREYFIRENEKDDSRRSSEFWDQFILTLGRCTGISLDESIEVNEPVEDDGEEVYEKVADYCNTIASANELITLFAGRQVTSRHISWAWGIVKMKCINLDAEEVILTF
ncbi:hypothetical protein AA313_de0208516 [Arthrobotrys entomopaga]|nr:hypothetical protein AA313_de0208516 [Arthrobotrys entomopaga]